MLKKYGRFYADWEDETGRRLRKSFPTKRAALNHQTIQRANAAAKKAPASARSRR